MNENSCGRRYENVNRKTIAIDFDGVLHAYSKGWQDGSIYDDPMPGAINACKALAINFDLVVFTTREDIGAVSGWLSGHRFPSITVTNKKPLAVVYIDDRALRFTSWAQTLLDLEGALK